MALDPDAWAKLSGPTRDDAGRLVTGDPVVDAWEREAWEEAARE
jgi:hypothetical protein